MDAPVYTLFAFFFSFFLHSFSLLKILLGIVLVGLSSNCYCTCSVCAVLYRKGDAFSGQSVCQPH